MVKLERPTDHCQIVQNIGFSETFSFSKITFWKKEKTLSSLNNYSTSLLSTGITFQDKGKYSTQYNYSILQLEYFFLTSFTMTRTSMHTAWISWSF